MGDLGNEWEIYCYLICNLKKRKWIVVPITLNLNFYSKKKVKVLQFYTKGRLLKLILQAINV